MDLDYPDATTLILRRFRDTGPLNDYEVEFLSALSKTSHQAIKKTTLLQYGVINPIPMLILSGWAARVRTLPDGRDVILSLYIPGDLLNTPMGPTLQRHEQILALTDVTFSEPKELMNQAYQFCYSAPNIVAGLGQFKDLEEHYLLDHLIRLGYGSSYNRLAHCLMNLFTRLSSIGMTSLGRFHCPLNQTQLGSHLAMTAVHTNRMLRDLREQKVLTFKSGIVNITDKVFFKKIADWTP